MNINTRVYLIIVCLLLLLPIKQALTDEAEFNKMLPKILAEPKGLQIEQDENADTIFVKLRDAITGKFLQLEIEVNGNSGNTPFAVNFKANANMNIKFRNPDYLAVEYDHVFQGGDSDKDFVVNCYPNLAIIKGDVLNPDGSIPENVEIKYQEDLPENYYPGYHKLRNYIDSEGKYFIVLPAGSVKEKAKIELRTNKYKFETELSLMKSQPIKAGTFEIPVFEAEIAMPDESMKEESIDEALNALKFQSNGKLSFEQAYKIEKGAELGDYGLIVSTYMSCYELAEDDATREFIKLKLLPILLDSVRFFELKDDVTNGLKLAKQGLEIFTDNEDLSKLIEIFEYMNVPASVKAELNDAFTEFNNKNFLKSFYLLKALSMNPQLTEKLRKKVVDAYNESRDLLIENHVQKATDYFKSDEYLKSLWEIDKAAEFSQDIAILKLLAERNIAKLKEANNTSKFALPLRKGWMKTESDSHFNYKLDFAESGASKWFVISVDNFSEVKIEFPMKNIEYVNYKLNIYVVNEDNLEPSTEVFSFDSNNVKMAETEGKMELGGTMGSQPGVNVPNAENEAKENVEPKYGFDYYKESLDQFIFTKGKYFIKVESNAIEGFKFADASCGLIMDVNQVSNKSGLLVKQVVPGQDLDSAAPIDQGFYSSFSIAPKTSQWFEIKAIEGMHMLLSFVGVEDCSSLEVKVCSDDEENVLQPQSDDEKAGVYVYKLDTMKYQIKIENIGSTKIDFSMLVRFADSSLYDENKVGSDFDNAIPIARKQLENTVRRNNSVYYKFKVSRRTYVYANLSVNSRIAADIELRVYAEDKDKNRLLIETIMGQRSYLYYSDYLAEGIYYIVIKSNSLREQKFRIQLSGGVAVISTGKKFDDPIRILADGSEKTYDVNNDDGKDNSLWLQFQTDDSGYLNIDYKLSGSTLDKAQYEKLSIDLFGSTENDVIQETKLERPDDEDTMRTIKKYVGKGLYHVKLQNNTDTKVRFVVSCSMSKVQDNTSFDKALSIPNETIYGYVSVESEKPAYFKLSIPDKGFLQIYSIFKFNKGDVNLKLYDSEQKLVISSETKNNDELINIEVAKGEYYLVVENVTNGLKNFVKLNIAYDNGENTITSAEFWDIEIPEDINQSGEFVHEKRFVETCFSKFQLNRRRRMQFSFDAENEQTEFIVKIYHGNEIIETTKSRRGKCYIDSEIEGGIYFVNMFSESKNEILTKISIINKPSVSSMRGEFDNVTRDSAIRITKASMFPIVYQGEQALWYRIDGKGTTSNLEVSLHCQDEKYEYTLSLYESNQNEPLEVKYSNEYPVVLQYELRTGLKYYVKLEPVEPVQSSKIVLAFLVGPTRINTNNLSNPYPLSSGKPETHKVRRNNSSYYVMCFAGQTKYKITCKFDDNAPDIDIALYKITGEIVADSEGTGNTEIIEGEIEPGIYRLEVKYSVEYWGETEYTIQADYEIIGALLSPISTKTEKTVTWNNTTKEKAILIEADKKVEGTASSISAWYSIVLTDNAKLTIKMESDISISNLNVFLVNSQGRELQSSMTDQAIEIIERECTNDVYYIRVSSFEDSNENKFSLIATVEDVGGGHSRLSAIVTELKPSDKNDDRKFKMTVDTTMKTGFSMWYIFTFEKPAWIEINGSVKGGQGSGSLSLLQQNSEVGKEEDVIEVKELNLIDPSFSRFNRNQTNNEDRSINLGLPAGTYYFRFTGNFSTGKIELSGTYIDGITNKSKAPLVGSGTFNNMLLTPKTDYWFKVKSAKTFKIVSSISLETDLESVKLVLQSEKVDVCDAFMSSKSAIIYSEVAAGEYYIMIKNTSDKDITVNSFQILILDDTPPYDSLQLLKANSKTTGTIKSRSEERKMYLFVLTEESKVKFSLKIQDGRNNSGMTILRIAPQEIDEKRSNNNRTNLIETKLKAGVYILYMQNYYYSETNYILEFEIQGSDFSE